MLCAHVNSLCLVKTLAVEIGRYSFFGANANISAIRAPILPKFLNRLFCFIIKNIMYSVPYLFLKNVKNHDL